LYAPQGIAVDSKGDVYIADTGNNAVRVVTPDGNINTVAGDGIAGHDGDGGPASQATLAAPSAVAVDSAGLLYIADSGTRIRRIESNGNIDTVAGSGAPGYSGDGGLAVNAQMNGPASIAFDAAGRLFIADEWNNAVRVLTATR
jgi:sugar lactone lactonase YvrE